MQKNYHQKASAPVSRQWRSHPTTATQGSAHDTRPDGHASCSDRSCQLLAAGHTRCMAFSSAISYRHNPQSCDSDKRSRSARGTECGSNGTEVFAPGLMPARDRAKSWRRFIAISNPRNRYGFSSCLRRGLLGHSLCRVFQPEQLRPGLRQAAPSPVADHVLTNAQCIGQLANAALGLNCGLKYVHDCNVSRS